jgi:hypothetical protein
MKKLLMILAVLALCLCAFAAYAGNTSETVTVTVDPVNNLSVPLTGSLILASEDAGLTGHYALAQSATQTGWVHHNDASNVYLTAQCTTPAGGDASLIGNDINLQVQAYTTTLPGATWHTIAGTAVPGTQTIMTGIGPGATPFNLMFQINNASLALTHSGTYVYSVLFTSNAN